MRIVLVIGSLELGGAERLAADLASLLTTEGHSVRVVTRRQVEDFFLLDQSVDRVHVGRSAKSALRKLVGGLGLLRRLRRAIRAYRPDVVVSSLEDSNALTLLACSGLRFPIVIWWHNYWSKPVALAWRVSRRLLYHRAAGMVVASPRTVNGAQQLMREKPVWVVPSFLPRHVSVGEAPQASPDAKVVIASGRLEAHKGFDVLIAAFAELAQKHVDWTLEIFGDGPQRQQLEELAAEEDVQHRIKFHGPVVNHLEALSRGSVFVLASRVEGFSNVLLEAMLVGLAVAAFDCPTGPEVLVADRQNGLLVECGNAAALTDALDELMTSHSLRTELGKRAVATAGEYDHGAVVADWSSLLQGVASHSGPPQVQRSSNG